MDYMCANCQKTPLLMRHIQNPKKWPTPPRGHIIPVLLGSLISICFFLIIIIIIINKKDGYRQLNVRQRQKLISIIDYDVRILEYLQPFWRFST